MMTLIEGWTIFQEATPVLVAVGSGALVFLGTKFVRRDACSEHHREIEEGMRVTESGLTGLEKKHKAAISSLRHSLVELRGEIKALSSEVKSVNGQIKRIDEQLAMLIDHLMDRK